MKYFWNWVKSLFGKSDRSIELEEINDQVAKASDSLAKLLSNIANDKFKKTEKLDKIQKEVDFLDKTSADVTSLFKKLG